MAKRTPAPSADDIVAAFTAATQGKGRRLAVLVKSFSTDDLASAFSRVGALEPHAFIGLGQALAYAAGLKDERTRMTAEAREWRKVWRKKT